MFLLNTSSSYIIQPLFYFSVLTVFLHYSFYLMCRICHSVNDEHNRYVSVGRFKYFGFGFFLLLLLFHKLGLTVRVYRRLIVLYHTEHIDVQNAITANQNHIILIVIIVHFLIHKQYTVVAI